MGDSGKRAGSLDWGLSEVEDCWGQDMTKTLSLTELRSGSSEPSSGLGLNLGPHPYWACLAQFREIPDILIFGHTGLSSARILLSLFS